MKMLNSLFTFVVLNIIYMEKISHIIEYKLDVAEMEREDSGNFMSFQIAKDFDDEYGMYVKICSWDENKSHSELEQFINRKVRVTIETID